MVLINGKGLPIVKDRVMKVLWLCNNSPIDRKKKGGGGWLSEMAFNLKNIDDIDLVYCFPSKESSGVHCLDNEKYYTFPNKFFDFSTRIKRSEILFFADVIKEEQPDIIHIWGTEFAHSLAMIKATEMIGCVGKVVVHIQGLCTACAQNYDAGLPFLVRHGFTLRDLLLGNVSLQKKHFSDRGQNELKVIKTTQNVAGRTTWDFSYTKLINPLAEYYNVGELMREQFYLDSWNLDKCTKHRVFMSQGSYPIKGLHFLIKALKVVKQKYPDVTLVVAGSDVTKSRGGIKSLLQISFYGLYIRYLISKYKLTNNVLFTGPLDVNEMKKQYLDANVYVLPSIVENSPNSLGEAMLLGVPCIASYVGGIPDFIRNNETGFLYPFHDYHILTQRILDVFDSGIVAQKFSYEAKKAAVQRYNSIRTVNELLECYRGVYKRNNNARVHHGE